MSRIADDRLGFLLLPMILTCPNCASRYFVDDAKLGAAGKQVRCAACGTKWHAQAPQALDLDLDILADPIAEPGFTEAAIASEPEKTKDPAKGFREKVRAEKLDREAKATGVIWAGMGAFLIVLSAASLLFRSSVVDLWPRTAGAYASIGLPVNRIGLEFEKLKAEPILEGGHAGLRITGGLRNVTGKAVTAPDIEIRLTNPGGKVVAGKKVTPADRQVPAGQVRFFTVTLLDPPSTAKDMLVGFAAGAGGKAERLKTPAQAEEAAPALRPATDPDAITTPPGAPAAVEELH
ncbi:MAG: hypothetical protein JWM33_889 [Caulobacteraceae bacterium]|nr:hypothetical protein [Caulobacteraceae bacterium]